MDYYEQLSLALDVYSDYDQFLLTGDFNAEYSETCQKTYYVNLMQNIWLNKRHASKVLFTLIALIFS